MPTTAEPRVALYFDFDNIVISRYDQLHGDGAYRKDTSRGKAPTAGTQTAERLVTATVDIDAVLDFAATFGTIAIARAYADWSTPDQRELPWAAHRSCGRPGAALPAVGDEERRRHPPLGRRRRGHVPHRGPHAHRDRRRRLRLRRTRAEGQAPRPVRRRHRRRGRHEPRAHGLVRRVRRLRRAADDGCRGRGGRGRRRRAARGIRPRGAEDETGHSGWRQGQGDGCRGAGARGSRRPPRRTRPAMPPTRQPQAAALGARRRRR